MAAIATLINPLSSPEDPMILQFSTNTANSLVYQDVSPTSTSQSPIKSPSKILSGPAIAANSSITVVVFENTIQVYGIIATSEKSVDLNYMCLLSPTIRPMKEITTGSGAIASATGTDATGNYGAFLYFLASESSGTTLQLTEVPLATDGVPNLLPTASPALTSNLAAFYNPVTFRRWAIFQDSSNFIWFMIISDTNSTAIQSLQIAGAQEGTPLAACYNAVTKSFYIYFLDAGLQLRRGTGDPNGTDVTDVAPLGIKLDSDTTISVTPDPTGQINHVFFVINSADDGRVIRHMLDNVDPTAQKI